MHPFSFADRYNASGTYGVDHYAVVLSLYNFVTSAWFAYVNYFGNARIGGATYAGGVCFIFLASFAYVYCYGNAGGNSSTLAHGTCGVNHYAILLDSYNFVTSERFAGVRDTGNASSYGGHAYVCGVRLIQVRNFSFDDILL